MRFLYALFDDKDDPRSEKGAISINLCDAERYNKEGYGIFASVNSFKTSRRIESNLDNLEYYFVDLDSGSREMQHRAIMSFPLIPTVVVSTKNGYHCYWKCEGEQTVEQYKEIVLRLIQLMDGDPNAKDVTRILRVPNFYHMKNINNPYLIQFVGDENDNSYTFEEMDAELPELSEEKKPKSKVFQFNHTGIMDKLYMKQAKIHAVEGLERLSGAPELDSDKFTFKQMGNGKFTIYANGEKVPSCWIDIDGMIGSHDNGGPTIANWIHWYVNDWAKVSVTLEKYFPELKEELDWKLK